MYPTQSNTQAGPKAFTPAADFTGKEGLLCKITNASGVPNAALLAAAADHSPAVIVSGATTANKAYVQFLEPNQNARVRLNGTCVSGDLLVRADETGADAGKVTKLPAGAGTYTIVGIAEETGADEQLVLLRPYRLGDQITVV